MHVPSPPHACAYAATGKVVGPASEELDGVVQSAWNLNSFSEFVPRPSTYSGDPLGGGTAPSTFAGSSPGVEELKHCCVAERPASIFARSHAHTFADVKNGLNML